MLLDQRGVRQTRSFSHSPALVVTGTRISAISADERGDDAEPAPSGRPHARTAPSAVRPAG